MVSYGGHFRFNTLFADIVDADLASGAVPMLIGEPGIGKSSWVVGELANKNHTKCFTLACNQIADKCDLTGARSVKDENGDWVQVFFPHEIIVRAIRYAEQHPTERPILFMDEINRTTPDVTSELLSIPTARQIANVQLPDNLAVVVAGNDKGNVTVLDDASVTRFVLYHVGPDIQTFLAVNPELNEFVKAALEKKPEGLFQKAMDVSGDGQDSMMDVEELLDEEDGMKQFTTPRTITGVSNWLNNLSEDTLLAMMGQTTKSQDGETRTLLEEAIIAHIGNTPFAVQLNLEIAAGINNVGAANQKLSAPRPRIWNTLVAQSDRDSLDDFVDQMGFNDLSGCLVYALYDKGDRTQEIQSIVSRIDDILVSQGKSIQHIMSNDDIRMLMQLFGQQRLNQHNIEAMAGTNGKTWETFRQILTVY